MRRRDLGIRGIPSLLSLSAACMATACNGSSPSPSHFATAAGAVAEPSSPRSAGAEPAVAPAGLVPSLRAPGEARHASRRVDPVAVRRRFERGRDQRATGYRTRHAPAGLLPPNMSPFGPPPEQGPTGALGTGFIVSSDGYILTNNHVVANAERVTVSTAGPADLYCQSHRARSGNQCALIKIDAVNLPTLTLGDDSTAQVGDAVMAVGNPLGLDFTVTSGIVSAKGRSEQLRDLFATRYAVIDLSQTNAVIQSCQFGRPVSRHDWQSHPHRFRDCKPDREFRRVWVRRADQHRAHRHE